jgi:NAD(P)-dependent dehydrogenase (short-subunit alcohol dehydrogenase family)
MGSVVGGGTVVLTGATSGIGLASARSLAPRTDRLVVHGPEPEADVAHRLAELRALAAGDVDYLQADYGDLTAVAGLAEAVSGLTPEIGVLVNNAGRPGAPRRTLTRNGLEATWQVNYLAPVLLTSLLCADIAVRRIVNVASATHFSGSLALDDPNLAHHTYSPSAAYARSKLALVTYTGWLARHLPSGVSTAVSMHPGVVATELLHAMFSVGGGSPEWAATNVVTVASASNDNGTYYDGHTPAGPAPDAQEPTTQDLLHALTDRQLAASGR